MDTGIPKCGGNVLFKDLRSMGKEEYYFLEHYTM
jgi:hypothetical protein